MELTVSIVFIELVTWEESVLRPFHVHIPSKKPSKDLLPYMLDGPCTFTNTRLRHEDKGDEQRKRLASSSCVKGGIVRRLEIYHLLVLKKSSNHRPVG